MPKRAMPDVVVLLPGILGSVLARDGKDVWALNGGAAVRALLSLGGSIRTLQLDEDPADEDDLGDGITAPRLMPDLHLLPGLWKIDGYTAIERTLFEVYDLQAGRNWFTFPYDWRRDNRVAARRLARDTRAWLAEWRDRSGNADAKLILLGHSMGGLVARWFLECLDGWKDTRALITFGTPYRGSVNALEFLNDGFRKGFGPFKLDLTAMVRSFTSVHQLLPDYRCLDAGDDAGLVRLADGPAVPGIDGGRLAAATSFHRDIADAVTAHLDDDAYRRDRYDVHPIVGIRQPTLQSARLSDGRIEALRTYEGEDTDGDGTVPMQSATPVEWQDAKRETFSADRHASLQNAQSVLVQVDGLLRGEPVRFRELAARALSLDVDDLYEPGEPVGIGVGADRPGVPLLVTVADAGTDAPVARASATSGDELQRLDLPPLPVGTYRLTLESPSVPPAQPVRDVFVVLDEGDMEQAADPPD